MSGLPTESGSGDGGGGRRCGKGCGARCDDGGAGRTMGDGGDCFGAVLEWFWVLYPNLTNLWCSSKMIVSFPKVPCFLILN